MSAKDTQYFNLRFENNRSCPAGINRFQILSNYDFCWCKQLACHAYNGLNPHACHTYLSPLRELSRFMLLLFSNLQLDRIINHIIRSGTILRCYQTKIPQQSFIQSIKPYSELSLFNPFKRAAAAAAACQSCFVSIILFCAGRLLLLSCDNCQIKCTATRRCLSLTMIRPLILQLIQLGVYLILKNATTDVSTRIPGNCASVGFFSSVQQ